MRRTAFGANWHGACLMCALLCIEYVARLERGWRTAFCTKCRPHLGRRWGTARRHARMADCLGSGDFPSTTVLSVVGTVRRGAIGYVTERLGDSGVRKFGTTFFASRGFGPWGKEQHYGCSGLPLFILTFRGKNKMSRFILRYISLFHKSL